MSGFLLATEFQQYLLLPARFEPLPKPLQTLSAASMLRMKS
jgi:hypothetical protein